MIQVKWSLILALKNREEREREREMKIEEFRQFLNHSVIRDTGTLTA